MMGATLSGVKSKMEKLGIALQTKPCGTSMGQGVNHRERIGRHVEFREKGAEKAPSTPITIVRLGGVPEAVRLHQKGSFILHARFPFL